ncbi:YceD family protein [Salinibacterium sp. GXW1014]|uniref:YceD family protein n=1 Tax=Salinibacterium sp. GXW1014 TaxID=3377838 RepID=UPI00383B823E
MLDLARRPGEMREVSREAPVTERLGNAVIAVEPGETIHAEARLESLHDGILVTAEVDSVAKGECVRCLTEVSLPVEVEIQEVFAYDEDEAFEYQVQDDHVDLEPVVRDAVVLSLPFQPVCQEDCLGLCPQCGVRLLDNPGHEHEEPIDPRWAKLAALEGLTEATTNDALSDSPDGDADREKR